MFEKLSKLKKLLSSQKALVGISFLVGLILGHILGNFRIHTFLSLPKISLNFSWLNWLGEVIPNPTFLSDVAAFEAAIIAFLVPLSIEIISKISQRYDSDVIIRSFTNNWKNKILPPFLLLNIVAAIALRFFVQEGSNSIILTVGSWVILLALIFIAFVIWRVIIDIKRIMSDTRSVLNELYGDIKKTLE
jgi:hypothetical protein